MFYWYVLIAVQIIIEMLPISSSGHIQVLELFLKKYRLFPDPFFFDKKTREAFYYFLHGPTLLIVAGYFFNRWLQLLVMPDGIAWQLPALVIVADVVTAACYWFFRRYRISFPLGIGFIVTALALRATAGCCAGRSLDSCSWIDALIIGAAQGIALLPGISRLALTSSVGCLRGFSLADAFFISWTIQTPLMAAALVKSVKELHQRGAWGQILNLSTALVMLASSGFSIGIMGIVLSMAQHNSWYFMGWYMIIPCIVWALIGTGTNVRGSKE